MRRPIRGLITAALAFALTRVFTPTLVAAPPTEPGPWPVARAQAWAGEHPWLVGCNFAPSTAINQLEMWQADTFDLATIDRELGWAEGLGFTSIRVFLHHLPWEKDSQGFLHRIEQFLATADRHKIGVMFVLFDGVWDPFPHSGKQHRPHPGLHNSGWVQSPGAVILKDPQRHDELKDYVTGVIGRFRSDRRIDAWDLFNEPDNLNPSSYRRYEPANKAELSLALLSKEFAWARSVKPSPAAHSRSVGRRSDQPRTAVADQPVHARPVRRDQLPQLQAAAGNEARRGKPEAVRPAALMHRVHGPAGRQPLRSHPGLSQV